MNKALKTIMESTRKRRLRFFPHAVEH